MAKARREVRLYDSLGRRNGWITRRAKAEGKNVDRVHAAVRGAETRRRAVEHAARVHGEKARVKTESRLTPQQKAKRTRDANRIERGPGPTGPEGEPIYTGRGGYDHGEEQSLDDLIDRYDDYDDWDYWDVETSPDYEITGK
jgi:hypothetical protein